MGDSDKLIEKTCRECGEKYMAPEYEIEILMILRMCPACIEKWENKKKPDDDDWSTSYNGSAAIGGVI